MDAPQFTTIYIIEGYIGCYQLFTIINEAAINIYGHKFPNRLVSAQEHDSWGVSRAYCGFVSNCHTVWQSGRSILHSHQQ